MSKNIRFFVLGLCILYGIFMAIAPNLAVKKEKRDSEEEIEKAKRDGIMLSLTGIIVFAVCYYLTYIS